DVLLEKPIATTPADLHRLLATARKSQRTVMICHVLRYAPFYLRIRELIANGTLGDILTIETSEHVSYFHMAVGFVRGKWNRKDRCHSSMLMAKCCHDLDLLTWLKSGIAPTTVHSFGNLSFFRKENAPPNSGTRCLLDCQIEPTCPYSAKTIHIDQNLFHFYAWETIEHLGGKNATREQKLHSLKTDNPHGRCVWQSDNDVVDHQNLIIQFADNSIASHTMVGGSARGCRNIHIVGTKAEIQGTMEDAFFLLRKPNPTTPKRHTEEKIETTGNNDMHGGGDLLLVADFLRQLRNEPQSLSATTLEDSIHGAQIAFAADESRINRHPSNIPKV
ncbi:MAG: Gfo/Idh/MocA family oxidoreductase, partial [Phycisphaerales bacterium]|nr:Gfo/Idh/MocA family oxidoreductase [Phycisphaerales bacterium]